MSLITGLEYGLEWNDTEYRNNEICIFLIVVLHYKRLYFISLQVVNVFMS